MSMTPEQRRTLNVLEAIRRLSKRRNWPAASTLAIERALSELRRAFKAGEGEGECDVWLFVYADDIPQLCGKPKPCAEHSGIARGPRKRARSR